MIDVLILAGGDISQKLNYIRSRSKSPALIPVSTRLLASYVIDFYKKQADVRIILVVEDSQYEEVASELRHYMPWFILIKVSNTNGVVDTLKKVLVQNEIRAEVVISLVTTIPKRFPVLGEVQISNEKTDTNAWSSVVIKDSDVEFLSKKIGLRKPGNAFTGVFHVQTKHLEQALESTYEVNDLLSVVENICKFTVLNFVETDWLDCGHEMNYYDTRAKLISSRSFNKIKVFPEKGILRKSSVKGHKLKAEEQYICALPTELKTYYPRVIREYFALNDEGFYDIEYYGYPNLSEYFLYWNLSCENWRRIFDRMSAILKEFSKYSFSIGEKAYLAFYYDKTVERVDAFFRYVKTSNREYAWLEAEVLVNGAQCLPFSKLRPYIKHRIQNLYSEKDFCVMHGDFCFNNILYDVPTGIIRLIDPRGSFGNDCIGLYGDRKYDLAKLLHSAIGHYDYFANDLFSLKSDGLNFEYTINTRTTGEYVEQLCRALVVDMGYEYNDIVFISGLLFVSMAVLHDDSYERQQIMYLHGLKILNEQFKLEDDNENMY